MVPIKNEVERSAQMSVIGCIIIKPEVMGSVLETGITTKMFCFEDTRLVFEAIMDIFSEGKDIDYISVLSKASSKCKTDGKDIKKFIFECTELVPAPSRASYYSEIVVNGYKARKLYDIASDFLKDLNVSEDVNSLADKVMNDIYLVSKSENDRKIEDISNLSDKFSEEFDDKNTDNQNISNLGFEKLDSIVKGLCAGNLVVLAARPKVGKTAFALSVAKNVAFKGKTVAFYSLEMEKMEIYERLVSEMAEISMDAIIDRKLDKNDLEKIRKFFGDIKNLSLKISDKADVSVSEIRSQCRLIKNLGLIVIDYLQLIKSTKKFETRNQEVGHISRELKLLASDLHVPVLCLAQLNRATLEDKRPTPNDLRDSGEIEQNCSKLMLMWCTEKHYTEIGSLSSKTVGIDVALNRRGNSGIVLFNFNGEFMSFKELEKKYEEKKNFSNWK